MKQLQTLEQRLKSMEKDAEMGDLRKLEETRIFERDQGNVHDCQRVIVYPWDLHI